MIIVISSSLSVPGTWGYRPCPPVEAPTFLIRNNQPSPTTALTQSNADIPFSNAKCTCYICIYTWIIFKAVTVKGRSLKHHIHRCRTISRVVRVPWHVSSSPCMGVVGGKILMNSIADDTVAATAESSGMSQRHECIVACSSPVCKTSNILWWCSVAVWRIVLIVSWRIWSKA